jgi:hypothetical protein
MQRKSEKELMIIYGVNGDDCMSEVNLATIQLNGEKQSFILAKKDFKTGSKGYHALGKMQIGEKNYQINILCVEIGSKPKEKK